MSAAAQGYGGFAPGTAPGPGRGFPEDGLAGRAGRPPWAPGGFTPGAQGGGVSAPAWC